MRYCESLKAPISSSRVFLCRHAVMHNFLCCITVSRISRIGTTHLGRSGPLQKAIDSHGPVNTGKMALEISMVP